MTLKILNESLFDNSSDAVILTIDGMAQGMGGKAARTFSELYPETWKYIESKIQYPITAGGYFSVLTTDGVPFKVVFLAATLTHLPNNQNNPQKSLALLAFNRVIRDATNHGLTTIRCCLPVGGWRIDPLNAFMILSQILEKNHSSTKGMELQLCILKKDEFESVRRFASNLGYEV